MRIFDSHGHYDDPRYKEDFPEVLEKLASRGVQKVMTVSTDPDSCEEIMALARENPLFCCSAGIHPSEAENLSEDSLLTVERQAKEEIVKAVGEIGLDYHYGKDYIEKQKHFFREQLKIAKKIGKPVIIHSREATQDTLEIIREVGFYNGVVHCFSGSLETMKELLELGFYIGFTGVVTFKNARAAVENVSAIPLERLLVETDCPYMAPEPYRGTRNDSSYLVEIIEKIAEIKGLDPEEVAEATYKNAENLFLK
jgi:TatD DNase family protein